jgi:hypothetical protein
VTVLPDATVAWRRLRPTGPQAFCPVCGNELRGPAKITTVAEALCPGRCRTAWKALELLRETPQATKLTDLLLAEWRAGDWRVEPETILKQLAPSHRPEDSAA